MEKVPPLTLTTVVPVPVTLIPDPRIRSEPLFIVTTLFNQMELAFVIAMPLKSLLLLATLFSVTVGALKVAPL